MATGIAKPGYLAARPCGTAPQHGAGSPRPGAISTPGRQASSLCGQDARRPGSKARFVSDAFAPTWTNHPHALRPLASQQVQTNSATQFINIADEISSSRRTYNPTNSAAGDTEAIAARGSRGVPPRISQAGRLRSYLVLINGAAPTVQAQTGVYPSELFSHRNPTYNENTIAVSSDRGALEISGTNLMYEGARVKTWIVGRDLNPGGRGDGAHYAQGMFSAGMLRPIPASSPIGGFGNAVNNGSWGGGGLPATGCTDSGGCPEGTKGSPTSCCCANTDDALAKCLGTCGKGSCCCQTVWLCGCPCNSPTLPTGYTHEAAIRENKNGYADAFCAYLRCNVQCSKDCIDTWICDPDSLWGCCKDFCEGRGGGGGAGSAGGGGIGSGGGCSGCGGAGANWSPAEDTWKEPSIVIDLETCRPGSANSIDTMLKMIFACLKGCKSEWCKDIKQQLSKIKGTLYIRCCYNYWVNQCCNELTNPLNRICCKPGRPAVSCASGDSFSHPYVLLCPDTTVSQKPYYYDDFQCEFADTLIHEILHHAGIGHNSAPKNNYDYAKEAVLGCFCWCKYVK